MPGIFVTNKQIKISDINLSGKGKMETFLLNSLIFISKKGKSGWKTKVLNDQNYFILILGHIYEKITFKTIIKAIEKKDFSFLEKIDGAFNIVALKKSSNRLIFISDRFNRPPLYYYKKDKFFFVSSEIKTIAYLERPSFDNNSLLEFFTCEGVMGNKTMFKNIYLLEPGAYLTIENSNLNINYYYKLRIYQNKLAIDEAIEIYHNLLIKSVEKRLTRDTGIYLSGGMDSRLLLFSALEIGYHPRTYTFGTLESDDVLIASQIAKETGVKNLKLGMDKNYLKKWAKKGVSFTDGAYNIIRMHGIDALSFISDEVESVFNGFGGDYLMRFSGWFSSMKKDSLKNLIAYILKWANIVIPFNEIENAFTEDFLKDITQYPIKTIENFIKNSKIHTKEILRLYYFLKERMLRLTVLGLYQDAPYIFSKTPFTDLELMRFALQLPQHLRRGEKLRLALIKKYYKTFKHIPWSATGMGAKYPYLFQIIGRWWTKRRYVDYADYNTWFRTNLKSFIKKYLFSERLLDSNIFKPEYIQEIFKTHMKGEDNSRIIGLIVTFSIWLEELY